MPKKNNNPDSIFPLLRIPALRKHTKMWAAQYDFVEKITLYEAPNSVPCNVKYVVVFDLPETADKELKLRIRTFKQFFIFFDGLPEVNESFYKEIYKEQFTPNYREEWLFTMEKPKGVVAECLLELYAKSVPNPKQSVDEFVRSLTIYPENNDTINIQIPGRKAEPFTATTLGFHKERGKEWMLLQEIIQEGHYYIGSTKDKKGDARRTRLTTVNKKLIKKLNEKFNAQIPSNYKLFEKSGHEKGTWKPRFKTQPAGRYSNFTKEQLLEKLKAECSKGNDANQETINELVVAAKEKGISNDDLKDIIPSKCNATELCVHEKENEHITYNP